MKILIFTTFKIRENDNWIPDCDDIHIIVQCLEPLDGFAGTHVGVQVELFPQLKVERSESFTNRGHEGTFQADFVAVYGVNSRLVVKIRIKILKQF